MDPSIHSTNHSYSDTNNQRKKQHKRTILVLCFDGTGNKFQGNDGDSNIIKIYSMLDRQAANTYVYYQPGIGTYVEDSALTKTGHIARLRSWYEKAKDQAVGTSFDVHVRGGYEFLMRHYVEGAEIYMFGFSRGAYTARFLAQMLDNVGLLSSGNESNFRFAWKAFSEWQRRVDDGPKKKETYDFMRAYRSTFSRPIRRIQFMGLFDTVNSVPRFENAWMKRSKVPYAFKSSTLTVRHAVAIDERRAKFRQNLVSQRRRKIEDPHPHLHHFEDKVEEAHETAHRRIHHEKQHPEKANLRRMPTDPQGGRFKPRANAGTNMQGKPPGSARISRKPSTVSIGSTTGADDHDKTALEMEEEESRPQDIKEIWFPGCHADIGGGWPIEEGEDVSLSHAPLVWMIREARAAGLPFDEYKLREAGYFFEDLSGVDDYIPTATDPSLTVPQVQVDGEPAADTDAQQFQGQAGVEHAKRYNDLLNSAWRNGHMHDSLSFKQGTPPGGVLAWRFMEYLPFTRFDLRPDGSWAPVRWPLPMGETRDIPDDAWIHHSALRRMEADETYRPGNLIVGGGGRGMRVAPKESGVGQWDVHREKGSLIGECLVRKPREQKQETNGEKV